MAQAIGEFKSTRKMGGSTFSKQYEDELVKKMNDAYESFVKRNESKHILNAYRTPAVLGLVMVISYLVSSILDMIGIDSLSDTAIFGLYIPLLLVGVWLYVRYSGNFREVGAIIDNLTATVWENVSTLTKLVVLVLHCPFLFSIFLLLLVYILSGYCIFLLFTCTFIMGVNYCLIIIALSDCNR